MHKYKLGQEVRLIGDRFGEHQGKLGKIIGLHIKSKEFYSDEYTVAVQYCYDKQYGKPKLRKFKASAGDLKDLKIIRALCYKDYNGKLSWFSEELSYEKSAAFERHPEMDFKRYCDT